MSEDFDSTALSADIIAASALLKPGTPETISSKGLIPYFKGFGLNDDNVVPAGLREYTTRVLEITGLPATMEGLAQMLKLEEVRVTLTSAIKAANKRYEAQKSEEAEQGMPDMSTMQGITPDQMRYFTEKAAEEKERTKAALNYTTDVFVNPYSQEEEKPKEDEIKPQDTPQNREEPLEDKPEPLPEPATAETPSNAARFCPRCGWVVDVPYNPEVISEEDKIQFVYSIMHRTPFKKTYGLFQNNIKVTFRSKTIADSELILEQLRRDSQHDKFTDLGHMNHFAVKYELALLLDSIEGPTTDIAFQLKPQLKDFLNEEEPLVKYADAIYNQYLVSDVLKQLIEVHYRSFTRLYSSLIDEAMSENFYNPA